MKRKTSFTRVVMLLILLLSIKSTVVAQTLPTSSDAYELPDLLEDLLLPEDINRVNPDNWVTPTPIAPDNNATEALHNFELAPLTLQPTGLESVYFQIVAKHSGKCLDVVGGPGGTGNGANVDQWACGGVEATNQAWRLVPVGNAYQLVARHSGRCLTVSDASSANGANVIQWTCGNASTTHQLWSVVIVGDHIQIRPQHSGKCLDVVGGPGGTANGANVDQWACGGTEATNQAWRLVPVGSNFQIKLKYSSKCINVAGGSGATGNGVNVQQWSCLGASQPSQLWNFVPTGNFLQIRALHSNKCLDVSGGTGATGNNVNIHQWECLGTAQTNQLWRIVPVGNDLQLQAIHSGKCAEVGGWSTADGGNVNQWECLGAAQTNQLWSLIPTGNGNGSGAVAVTGHGFDTCSAPNATTMQTWRNHSPYHYIGIYIGGSLRACAQPNLTSNWVSTTAAQGWKFVPTWVGPQAPCTSYSQRISYNTTTAYNQGVAEAQSAANAASALGLSNTIIYYDLEQHAATTDCVAATKAFINGWVYKLRSLGYKGGIYTNSYLMSNYANISNVPDAIWGANWYWSGGQGGYWSGASVYGMYQLSDSLWNNHQRIRQYAGDVTESYGSVSINIDSNVADGLVAVRTQHLNGGIGWQAMDLLAPNTGWALLNHTLYWTSDGGKQWRDITPHLNEPATIDATFFMNTSQGWVISHTDKEVFVSQTMDGGRNWHTTSVTELDNFQMGKVYVDFVDPQTGWILIKKAASINFSQGVLLRTADGGKTWQQFDVPIGAPVHFINQQVGWLAGGPMGNQLYRTADGGESWQLQAIVTTTPQEFKYGLPAFTDAQHGTLPVIFIDTEEQQTLQLYVTNDGGNSWSPERSTRETKVGPIARHLSLPTLNYLVNSQQSLPATTLSIVFATMESGWVYTSDGTCLANTCTITNRLLQTNDGGQSWVEIRLPDSD